MVLKSCLVGAADEGLYYFTALFTEAGDLSPPYGWTTKQTKCHVFERDSELSSPSLIRPPQLISCEGNDPRHRIQTHTHTHTHSVYSILCVWVTHSDNGT